MTFCQIPEMTLTLNAQIPSLTHLVVCIYQLSGHKLQLFLKYPVFIFSYRKAYVTKYDLAVK